MLHSAAEVAQTYGRRGPLVHHHVPTLRYFSRVTAGALGEGTGAAVANLSASRFRSVNEGLMANSSIQRRHKLAAAWKGHVPKPSQRSEVVRGAEKVALHLLEDPQKAAILMEKLPIERRRAVALSWALTELEQEFSKADKDHDGHLSYAEFKEWCDQLMRHGAEREEARDPSRRQLVFTTLATFVPFAGFGCVDNGLMVIYGDVIDGTIGVYLGMSMLASAALGNAISNIFGMLLHNTINRFAQKIGLPDAQLTLSQRKLPKVHTATTIGSTMGVFIGCLLGMTPLLFMDQGKKEEERASKKHA